MLLDLESCWAEHTISVQLCLDRSPLQHVLRLFPKNNVSSTPLWYSVFSPIPKGLVSSWYSICKIGTIVFFGTPLMWDKTLCRINLSPKESLPSLHHLVIPAFLHFPNFWDWGFWNKSFKRTTGLLLAKLFDLFRCNAVRCSNNLSTNAPRRTFSCKMTKITECKLLGRPKHIICRCSTGGRAFAKESVKMGLFWWPEV